MRILLAFIFGLMLGGAVLSDAGTYPVNVTVNTQTEKIIPLYVEQYNSTHGGTNYTPAQFVGRWCGEQLDKKALGQFDIMGQ